MKKILLWIPIVGVIAVAYYHFYKNEELTSFSRVYEFIGSVVFQALTTFLLLKYFIFPLL